jgi:DNA-directed RNA polymerase specialized sigma24 family protein
MTNEELAAAIVGGQSELIIDLWTQVERFIRRQAKRRLLSEPLHMQDLVEDLTNEGYFAVIQAAKGYRPDRDASFIHYLNFCLKTAFNAALGKLSEKQKKDPLHRASSIDAPASGDGENDLSLVEVLVDPLAEDEIKRVDDEEWRRDVHRFLQEAITHLYEGEIRRLLLVMLESGLPPPKAARRIGVADVKKAARDVNRAYLTLHRYMTGQGRKLYDDLDIGRYYGVGVGSFRNRLFTSTTEEEAIKRADFSLRRELITGEIERLTAPDRVDRETE